MSRQLSELIYLLYSPNNTEASWSLFLKELVAATSAGGAAFIAHDLRKGSTEGLYTHSDQKELDLFVNRYSRINPWMPKESPAFAKGGEVIPSESFLSLGRLQTTEFYNEWGRKNHVVYCVGANLGLQSGIFRYLSLHRGERDGPLSEDAISMVTLLLPHIQNSLLLQDKLKVVGDLTLALESVSLPVFLLDRDCHVLHMTESAGTVVQRNTALCLSAHNVLTTKTTSSRSLADEVKALSVSSVPFRVFRLTRPDGRNDITALLVPALSMGVLALPRFILILLDPDISIDDAYRNAGALYGLTPTEIRFAQALVAMGSLDQVVKRLELNRNTAKRHLAAISEKTGCKRQGQVISLFTNLGRITPLGDDARK